MIKKLLCSIIIILLAGNLLAQELRLIKGLVTDSIAIPGTEGESYAIYLPKHFDLNKKWPVVYVFDPAAKAKNAIQHFVEGAEKYGYVIAASNNVKNGDYQENFQMAGRLMDAVGLSFSIDEGLTFVSGFSGGARLASAIAVISKKIRGVIACGASYATNSVYVPRSNTFLFVGIVGDEDFNYREMKDAMEYLDSKKINADLLVFDGGHKWPPVSYITKALRLMTLKSMDKGFMAKDESLINEFYGTDHDFYKQLRVNNNLAWAYDDLSDMMKNYHFYADTDSLKTAQKLLRKDRIYKTQRNEDNRTLDDESLYAEDYMAFLPQDIAEGKLETLGFWDEEVEKLNGLSKSPKIADQKMALRLKGLLGALAHELSNKYNETEHLDNLLFINIFLTILNPENEDAYVNIIKYASLKSEYGMSLYYMEELLKTGFKDVAKLDAQEGMALLRIMPEYNELLRKYELEARY